MNELKHIKRTDYPKEESEMTKDEIIVMLAEQLAEVRHDRDLWKALYRNEIDKRLEKEGE